MLIQALILDVGFSARMFVCLIYVEHHFSET